MVNAKDELILALQKCNKTVTHIAYGRIVDCYWAHDKRKFDIMLDSTGIPDELNFMYDDGYGSQKLNGLIVFTDGTWLSRSEYDGAEWWTYNKCPTLEDINNM